MRLRDKVAMITGAAHGMGEAAAKLFAREGAKVVVTDILEADGAQVAATIAATGASAIFIRLDVADEEAWREALRSVVSRFGRLDVLVNNAGVSGAVGADLTRTEDFDRIMTVNARGTYLGVKHAVPEMRRTGGGAIVNVSSISGFIGQAFVHMGYNASKAAIRVMTKAAAVQHAKDGIRVNSVHPGVMPPMRTSVSTADPGLREKILAAVPMGRAGRVEEGAYAMLFLASDEASYITGTELVVDGGYLAV